MPRGRKIIIETKIEDTVLDEYKSLDLQELKREREAADMGISSSLSSVFRVAQDLYVKKLGEETLNDKHGLYSTKAAYDYLRAKGIHISFRAFGGRIERGTVPFVKIGRKRYIPQVALEDITNTKSEYYTVREAFEEYNKYNAKINLRAFIGRIEKGSVPSVKFVTRRLIPIEAVEALTHVSSKYYSITEALSELHKSGIRIKRNALERRLDRGRIPCLKFGGRRFVHEEVLDELVEKENVIRGK